MVSVGVGDFRNPGSDFLLSLLDDLTTSRRDEQNFSAWVARVSKAKGTSLTCDVLQPGSILMHSVLHNIQEQQQPCKSGATTWAALL